MATSIDTTPEHWSPTPESDVEHDDEQALKLKCKFNTYWYEIHEFAASCNTIPERKAYEIWINNLSKRFFCSRCQPHFVEYVKANPVNKSHDLIQWAFNFHNAVNTRLGKRKLEIREALISQAEQRKCKACEA